VIVVDPGRQIVREIPKMPEDLQLRFEKYSFARYSCGTGYFKMRFSLKSASPEVGEILRKWKGNEWKELPSEFQHIGLLRETENRRWYMFHAVFPTPDLYELVTAVSDTGRAPTYIDNTKGCSAIPFLKYEIGDTGFIPIVPRKCLSDIRSGFAVIRFATFKTRPRLDRKSVV
jgi:hypothetical protein